MNRFMRSWHRRLSILIALPFLLTITTGILMMTRSFNPWVAAPTPDIQVELRLSYADVLRIAQTVPEAEVKTLADIGQINAQPKNGLIRVRTKNKYEIMLNGQTGEVLDARPRAMSWLLELHEGAFFGKLIQFGLFLPMGITVLFLLISGVTIYIIGWRAKRRLRAS